MKSIDELIADRLAGEPLDADGEAALAAWEAEKGRDILSYRHRFRKAAGARARFLADTEAPYRDIVAAARRRQWRRLLPAGVAAACAVMAWGVIALLPRTEEPTVIEARIVPGTPHAELRLGDGQRVALSPGGQPVILSGGAIEIKDSANTLVYAERQAGGRLSRDTLVVPPGGEYSLELADGTRVHLNAGSELSFPSRFGEEGTREVRLTGEAYFEVSPDASRPFIVQAGEVTVRVLGTSFNVNAYAARGVVATTLVEGRVRVARGEKCLEARPGEQITFDEETGRMEIRPVDTELYTSWKDGYYLFRESPLEEIMTTLATWYNVTVRYADARAGSTRFTGRLQRFEDIQYLLEKFEETGAIAVTIRGNEITLDKPADTISK
ncbi:MAG: FecR domain-containing protein [Odoribacteraceae bacterium]|jgi:ferric-dicitrate binding protein FerR (iron transport regulator)|nr:FecR domain-containing protein [Odoribacteraceae bacterium]